MRDFVFLWGIGRLLVGGVLSGPWSPSMMAVSPGSSPWALWYLTTRVSLVSLVTSLVLLGSLLFIVLRLFALT